MAHDGNNSGSDGKTKPPEGKSSGSDGKTKLPEKITILIRGQNNSELAFKVKPRTQFKKVATVYCQQQGVSILSVRFLCDGERLPTTENTTIEELGLDCEEDDAGEPTIFIDCHMFQEGGGSWA